jgi:hypothetical protein
MVIEKRTSIHHHEALPPDRGGWIAIHHHEFLPPDWEGRI